MDQSVKRLSTLGIVLSAVLGMLVVLATRLYWLHIAAGLGALVVTTLCLLPLAIATAQFRLLRSGGSGAARRRLLLWIGVTLAALFLLLLSVSRYDFHVHRATVTLNGRVYHLSQGIFFTASGDTFDAETGPIYLYPGAVYNCDATGFFCARLAHLSMRAGARLQALDGVLQVVETDGRVVWEGARAAGALGGLWIALMQRGSPISPNLTNTVSGILPFA